MNETIELSSCCQAQTYESFRDTDDDAENPIYRCAACKNECDLEEVCLNCLGTGKVEVEIDVDHIITKKCPFHG